MSERKNAEMGFVDAWAAPLGEPCAAEQLAKLDTATPWEDLAAPVREFPEYQDKDNGGRLPWSAVTMLRRPLLAKWQGPSDPQKEEQPMDRLSFRRFVGLLVTGDPPDETSLSRFRECLREAELDGELFERTLELLERAGVLVPEGTLVGAAIIEQSRGSKSEDWGRRRIEFDFALMLIAYNRKRSLSLAEP